MKKTKPFEKDETWLQCMYCGHKTNLLEERAFKCPHCCGLYDVEHKHYLDGPLLKKIFTERAVPGKQPTHRSGVWRFKELIMPHLPEEDIVTLGEGNVPIVPAGEHLREWIGGDLDLWLILEGQSPTGSFKDFGGTVMMSVAKAAGVPGVVCSSTGDTSAMAAAYAAAAGLSCVVILPEGKVTPVQLMQPLVHGAAVITLPGDFDDCMRVVLDLVEHYDLYPANSVNPTRIEGHMATVFLLAQFFEWELPEWIAVPVGNGSNSSSIGKGMRLAKNLDLVPRTARILGCQSEAANPLSESWAIARFMSGNTYSPRSLAKEWKREYKSMEVGETTATAARIGNPVSKDKVMREICSSEESPGAMATASEIDLNEAVAVCGSDGIFVCPQTGMALAGLRDAVTKGLVGHGERVAVVSTATGLKFTEAISYRMGIHEAESGIIEAEDCNTETVARIMGL